MLELKEVFFTIQKDGDPVHLVNRASLTVPRGHFMAIVGPSGCGKTTLLKTIAGLNAESDGSIWWEGRNLAEEGDLEPWEIGYVPQFSIAYDQLTVDESVETATRLRVRSRNVEELDHRIDRVLEETGLAAIADRQVKILSGGQKRRLGLAMELVSGPELLLCDEVTSGLDPRSEREIVNLLHNLSRREGRTVISVTHSLAHLELYDSILVLHEGCVAYHGPPSQLTHYFSVEDTEEVYPKLAGQEGERWQNSWHKHREPYYTKLLKNRSKLIEHGKLEPGKAVPVESEPEAEAAADAPDQRVRAPGVASQVATLLTRRWRIFFRDRGQVFLQLAILICFPVLVALFSNKGQDQIRKLSDAPEENVYLELKNRAAVHNDQLRTGSAVSGIIMFEVVLLALMGSNNAAREIAGERLIMEKEKFGGVRPGAYLLSKLAFLVCLVLAQSIWMGIFVEFFWEFRGEFLSHLLFLVLVNAAMTAVCLAISGLMKTAEQASLLSIYLVGFQLPLSGAVLALPESIEVVTRPFISAYWAWSGSVESLQSNIYNAVKAVIDTSLSPHHICLFMLVAHVLVGIIGAWIGTHRHQWD
ncbi:MAG: ATP-binding cassette domain-containing protein [Akkermansiaceae bacterium]|nr:ATP-binding cassette domain-containing protein [Akkermansiaceae bacterium]NNM29141.1 ATP-binding cassette domain-containing protein [Akkermansiaceae bacterium]